MTTSYNCKFTFEVKLILVKSVIQNIICTFVVQIYNTISVSIIIIINHQNNLIMSTIDKSAEQGFEVKPTSKKTTTASKKQPKTVAKEDLAKVVDLPKEEKGKVDTIKTSELPKSNSKQLPKSERKTPDAAKAFPEHMRNIAFLLKNNSEIRRFTSIGIINYLLQKGELKGEKRYVQFLWNKFAVKCDGLVKEYFYTEPFFLNCLTASFASFAASAQRTINAFTQAEMMVGIEKAVDADEVANIAAMNEEGNHDK